MSEDVRSPEHEPPGVGARTVTEVSAGLLLLIALALGIIYVMFSLFGVPWITLLGPRARELHYPPPTLQVDQFAELHRLEARWKERLESYRWVDRSSGLVQIPIGQAMRIVAGRGERAFEPLESPAEPEKESPAKEERP